MLSRIEEEVVKKAKDLGLNISKTCENCLKQAIRQLEQLYGQKNPNSLYIDVQQRVSSASLAGPPVFTPN